MEVLTLCVRVCVVCARKYVNVYACMFVCMCIHIIIYVHVYIVCAYTCMCVCMCVCIVFALSRNQAKLQDRAMLAESQEKVLSLQLTSSQEHTKLLLQQVFFFASLSWES